MDNKRATILVVDDVPDNIMVLSEVLAADYDVLAATSGERALKIVGSDNPPDMVLLDVMMPGMNGFEVCRNIKGDESTAFVPVVMVTALSGLDDRVEALNAGADDFLTKPIDPTEVRARVRSLLRVKKLHDALQKSYRDLQALEQLRENLTYMIIHDLRTPLTAIIGGLDLLPTYLNIKDSARAEEMHGMALVSSYRLLEMINSMLDITKMESGEMQLVRASVDVGVLIAEVDNSMQPLAKTDGLVLSSEIAPSLPPLNADPEIAHRVMVNLIGNALKFASAGGIAGPAQEADDGFVKLSVLDNGPGIPAGYEDRIFEKFGQVESGSRKKLSTGLGLTFCKMAVEAHGGKIWVESGQQQGSKFSILWPAA